MGAIYSSRRRIIRSRRWTITQRLSCARTLLFFTSSWRRFSSHVSVVTLTLCWTVFSPSATCTFSPCRRLGIP